MTGWDLAWSVVFLVAIWGSAWENRKERRRVREALDRRAESELKRLALQGAIDRAWDAAHEFGDEPQIALSCVCEHLEHHVTPLPGDLERALSDPSIVVDRDHEIRLADGRTLAEHMANWREWHGFPTQRVRPCGEGPCMFEPEPGCACPWCGWERPA